MAAATKASAKSADTQPSVEQQVARVLAKTLWDRDFARSNPNATAEEKRAAWQAARAEYAKVARQIAGRLQRAGLTISATSAATQE